MYRYAIVVVVAVLLAATHWKAYVVGKDNVTIQWQQEKLKLAQEALKAEQVARQKEQQLVVAKEKAEKQYVNEKRKAAVAAASASAELDRLRDVIANNNNNRKENTGSCTSPRIDGGTGLEQQLLGQCATTLVAMASEADRLEAIIVGLQSYVKNVCLVK